MKNLEKKRKRLFTGFVYLDEMFKIDKEKGGITMQERLYAVSEIAKMYRISGTSVRRYILEGKLKAIKVGGVWRIKESDWEAFLKESNIPKEKRKGVPNGRR